MDPPIVKGEDIADEVITPYDTWTPKTLEQLDGFVPYDDPEMDMTMFAGIQPNDLVYVPAEMEANDDDDDETEERMRWRETIRWNKTKFPFHE